MMGSSDDVNEAEFPEPSIFSRYQPCFFFVLRLAAMAAAAAAAQVEVTACTYGKSRVRIIKNERGPQHKLQVRIDHAR